MGALPDDVKAKVMSLSKDALPIAERRRLYNQLGRRIKNPEGLAPGLVEQYLGYSGSDPKRFEMLKNFICDICAFVSPSKIFLEPHGLLLQDRLRRGRVLHPATASENNCNCKLSLGRPSISPMRLSKNYPCSRSRNGGVALTAERPSSSASQTASVSI